MARDFIVAMIASVMLRDRGMVCLEGPFLGVHKFPMFFPHNRIAALWATQIDRRDITSTVGTILSSTTRAGKRYVFVDSDWSQKLKCLLAPQSCMYVGLVMKVWNLEFPPGEPKQQLRDYDHTHPCSSSKRRRSHKNVCSCKPITFLQTTNICPSKNV